MIVKKTVRYTRFKKIAYGLFALVFFLAGLFYFFYNKKPHEAILDFNATRDTQFILDSFKRDWYWLVEGYDYSPEYMLRNKASSQRPEHLGNLTIKVAYHDNKPVGFVIYFMKNFFLGDVRFIDVYPDFRSQGWSDKLLDYAVKDLIKRGSSKIELVTRTTNIPAQRLYTRRGFQESHREDGFVYYEYLVDGQK